jgi:monofunctional biosynthetic peptidoglycan transglycosylase
VRAVKLRRLFFWTLVAPILFFTAAGLGLAALYLLTPSAAPLVRENPRTTALVEQRRAEARTQGRALRPQMTWAGPDRIAPRLGEAVVLSEDASFWTHQGFDFKEMRSAAWESARRLKLGRGASTITQQLAKNLWLGTDRSLSRKAREAALAFKLERALPKRRILSLYLNVAEWGDGTFGAEAGARRWFGVPARDLSTAQAVVLASMLPAPRKADLDRPPRWLAKRSRRLLDRMQAVGRIGAEEHLRASAELERILAGPAGDESEEVPEEEEPEVSVGTATPTATPTPTPTGAGAAPATEAAAATAPRGSPPAN